MALPKLAIQSLRELGKALGEIEGSSRKKPSDIQKLIQAIEDDDPISAYEPFVLWLRSKPRGALYVKQMAERCLDELCELGNPRFLKQITDYAIACERHLNESQRSVGVTGSLD